MNETTEPLLLNTTQNTVIARRLDWDFLTTTNSDVRDCMFTIAGWQLALSIATIIFAVVIAVYGPYVFGSKALIKGMSVTTEFWEFCLPLKYNGKSAEDKMDTYSNEAYVSKIRRFAGFIGFTMAAVGFLEMITGAVGRSALKNHEVDGGSLMAFESHVTLCVLCGIVTFVLLSISLLLGCGKQFIPEFMLVYSIRNLIMCILFTANWMHGTGFWKSVQDAREHIENKFDSVADGVKQATENFNVN